MSTQSVTNTTLETLFAHLIDQQQSQQEQLNTIKDAFKANKDKGAIIVKPAIFNNDADNAARFLPIIRNWAMEQKVLRIKERAGVMLKDVGKLDNRKMIQSTLLFCKGGEASCWVDNYLKQANMSMTNASVQFPFEGKWETFEKQFKVWFGAADKKVDAIRELEQMKQGSKAVTVYSQDFGDAGARTGMSDADLVICFESGLNPEVERLLVMMVLAQGDPKKLDDLEYCSCRAERALEAEGFSTWKHVETTTTTISTTQTTPARGNSKTREDRMRAMCNCCYGCRAMDHTKAQGNHGQEQCHHCKRPRHHASICQDKFLGHMPGLGTKPMRIHKINSAVPFTLFPGEMVNISTSPPASTTLTTPPKSLPPIPPVLIWQLAGSIFAQLGLTVYSIETWTNLLIIELGGENVILGLSWLWKTNLQVNWEKERVSVPKPKVTIKEIEDEDWWAGTGHPPLSDSVTKSIYASVIEDPPTNYKPSPPLHHIRANCMTQRALVKKGILEDCHDNLWIAARYTYSQQITEEASKGKPKQTFEEMVPPEYWGSVLKR
ncbi:hypothetical protein PQX77_018729 [Marasmius sp. AFHP31]|nr:hypothetical protein PQX77_018729 [Marasmius sp. AFHP31]